MSDHELLQRFVDERDESAFTALVEHHGRTVWGVCRRLLDREHDAEDAFQAVFLILARKAGSIRKGEAVGSWLYGVAYRTALRLRRTALRRQDREMQARTSPAPQPPWSIAAWHEWQDLLAREVGRLPDKHRMPFILCCLEGLSYAEAARELGWTEGTLGGRLAQARRHLQRRLAFSS